MSSRLCECEIFTKFFLRALVGVSCSALFCPEVVKNYYIINSTVVYMPHLAVTTLFWLIDLKPILFKVRWRVSKCSDDSINR